MATAPLQHLNSVCTNSYKRTPVCYMQQPGRVHQKYPAKHRTGTHGKTRGLPLL